MNIEFFCPRWGSEDLDWDTFFKKVQDAGYDGVEFAIANETTREELEAIWATLSKYDLKIIPQHYGTYDADFDVHYKRYAAWLELLKPFPALKINSQTGKDFFTVEQNSALIALADDFTKETGINISHETHRNKFSFACHVTKTYLDTLPNLKLTMDISHWVNVAESYLEDQKEAVDLALSRTEHVHARVGHVEGPQIPDPRATEWQETLEIHLKWWQQIVDRKVQNNDELLTIAPEFGPYPYMINLPNTETPIANQWDVNVFMMNYLRENLKK